ncbi:MAG: hypothetical protein VB058_03655 [Oscillospiraceae bacterium]|nr:hypothetical protein [Oscillospiraceae bacterium]
MEKKQVRISRLALFISIGSLLFTIITTASQNKEKLYIFSDVAKVISIDRTNNKITFSADITIANISRKTVSLLKYKAQRDEIGYGYPPKDINISANKDFPVILMQGCAVKEKISFAYPINADEMAQIRSADDVSDLFTKRFLDIDIYTAKEEPYGIRVNFTDSN